MEEEKQYYFDSFIKSVIKDLKTKKSSFVFNQDQFNEVSKVFKIKEVRRDDCCIWIKLDTNNKGVIKC